MKLTIPGISGPGLDSHTGNYRFEVLEAVMTRANVFPEMAIHYSRHRRFCLTASNLRVRFWRLLERETRFGFYFWLEGAVRSKKKAAATH
jgi:hypothetical protein